MKGTYINDFKEGMSVEGTYLCHHKALLKDKNGKPYLNLKFRDRTGIIEARVWDRAPQFSQNFENLDYVAIKGNVVSFQGHLQLNVRDIRTAPLDSIVQEDFLPHTQKDVEQMYSELLQLCEEELKNAYIKKLILSILEDPELMPAFKRSPAATRNHHAWVGGLLEHVLQLCVVGKDVLKHYPMVNSDLVLAGLILHDFGKVQELTAERSFEYTVKGNLIGHLSISIEIILKKASEIPNFPEKILYHLQHIILSHHGFLEYGSPKEPMTLEALMVHHLDNMDSKIQGFLDVLARETEGDPNWAAVSFLFKRPLYKKTSEDMGENPASHEKRTRPKNPPKPTTKKPRPKTPLKTNLGDLLSEQLKAKLD